MAAVAGLVIDIFRKFDANGTGSISRDDMCKLLKRLSPEKYGNQDVVDALLGPSNGGSIQFADFVTGLFSLRPLHLVFFGAPGSGKGTQSDILKKNFGVKHISSGDVLRDHVKRGTMLGRQAKEYMEAGELVPDDLIISLLVEETKGADANGGWLIDGMPRTRVQAEAMVRMGLDPAVFITLEVPDEVLEERITLRRLDPETGDIYHLKFKPPQDPIVEARLIQRSDDTAEKLKPRLQAYHQNLQAVKGFYRDKGVLVEIDGIEGSIAGVSGRLLTSVLQSRLPPISGEPLKLVFFGAPGSGKGTQSEKLKKNFGIKHISSGDVLRDHVQRGTALGQQAKSYMEAGQLVPDDLVISLLVEETKDATTGWLIDGMPRTKVQAEAMEKMGLNPQVFLTLEVPDEILEERITLRRTDPETGLIYHLKFKPPKDPEVENRLVQRKDDTAEKLKSRLAAYHDNLNCVKGFYRRKGVLVEIDGTDGGIDGVHNNLLIAVIKSRLSPSIH